MRAHSFSACGRAGTRQNTRSVGRCEHRLCLCPRTSTALHFPSHALRPRLASQHAATLSALHRAAFAIAFRLACEVLVCALVAAVAVLSPARAWLLVRPTLRARCGSHACLCGGRTGRSVGKGATSGVTMLASTIALTLLSHSSSPLVRLSCSAHMGSSARAPTCLDGGPRARAPRRASIRRFRRPPRIGLSLERR